MIALASLHLAALTHAPLAAAAKAGDIVVRYTQDTGVRPTLRRTSLIRLDRSGKPLTPNSQFRLQNGAMVSGKEYFDRLDTLEAKLNESGYSLNTAPDLMRVGSFKVAPEDQKSASKSLQNTMTVSGNSDQFKQEQYRSKPIITPRPGSQKGYVNPQYFGHNYSGSVNPKIWKLGVNMDWGFAAQGTQLHAKANPKQTKLDFDVNAHFRAIASAFDHQTSLVDASFAASCGETQPASIDMNLTLAGNKLLDFHRSVADTYGDGEVYSYPVDESFGGAFSLLPGIVLSAKIGVMGAAGFKCSYSLSPTALSGNITPFVFAKVYAQAGVGVGLAVDGLAIDVQAGVKANLTLVDESLPCDLHLGFVLDGPNHMGRGLLSTVSVKSHTNLFSGSLLGYAAEDLGFKTIEQDFPFFDFSGLTFDATVFERAGFIKL